MIAYGGVTTTTANALSHETLTDTALAGPRAAPEIALPHLFVVFEGANPAAGAARHALANVGTVLLGRSKSRYSKRKFEAGEWTLDIGVPDPRASSQHARLVRVDVDFYLEDLGSHNGTRVDGERITGRTLLRDGNFVEVGHTLLRYRTSLASPVGAPLDVDSATEGRSPLVPTIDPVLADRVAKLASVACSGSPVLLLGETGAGKEVVARGIHQLSGRRGAFIAVNCGALPATLLEAQLFGHTRGAFSGALTDAPGLLRSADGGTLLLDEIGDLPEASQAALLRALQEREVVPVGGVRPIKVDLRIVAATHRPLQELVEKGGFRNDLFARLAGYVFTIPPLRARREDIGLMVEAFARGRSMRFSPAAARALFRYDWPRNVRELHQALDVGRPWLGPMLWISSTFRRPLPDPSLRRSPLRPRSIECETGWSPRSLDIVATSAKSRASSERPGCRSKGG
jgi:hypothetical protein